jgi:hypothetical protein
VLLGKDICFCFYKSVVLPVKFLFFVEPLNMLTFIYLVAFSVTAPVSLNESFMIVLYKNMPRN